MYAHIDSDVDPFAHQFPKDVSGNLERPERHGYNVESAINFEHSANFEGAFNDRNGYATDYPPSSTRSASSPRAPSSTRSVSSTRSNQPGFGPDRSSVGHFNNGGHQQHHMRYNSAPMRSNSTRSTSSAASYSGAPNFGSTDSRYNGNLRSNITPRSDGTEDYVLANTAKFPRPYYGQSQQVGPPRGPYSSEQQILNPRDPYRNDPQSMVNHDPYRNDQSSVASHVPAHGASRQHGLAPNYDRGPQDYTNSAGFYHTNYAPHANNQPRPNYTGVSQQTHLPGYGASKLDSYPGAHNSGIQHQNSSIQRQSSHASFAPPSPENQNHQYNNPHARVSPKQYNMPYGDAAMLDHRRALEDPRVYGDNNAKPEMQPPMHKCVSSCARGTYFFC